MRSQPQSPPHPPPKKKNEYEEPLAHSHFKAEGDVEFKAVMFLPPTAPFGASLCVCGGGYVLAASRAL